MVFSGFSPKVLFKIFLPLFCFFLRDFVRPCENLRAIPLPGRTAPRFGMCPHLFSLIPRSARLRDTSRRFLVLLP